MEVLTSGVGPYLDTNAFELSRFAMLVEKPVWPWGLLLIRVWNTQRQGNPLSDNRMKSVWLTDIDRFDVLKYLFRKLGILDGDPSMIGRRWLSRLPHWEIIGSLTLGYRSLAVSSSQNSRIWGRQSHPQTAAPWTAASRSSLVYFQWHVCIFHAHIWYYNHSHPESLPSTW